MRLVLDADKDDKYREKHQEFLSDENEGSVSQSTTRRDVYISPEEMEKLRERYSHMIVQDFEDEYHMSVEDREKVRERYAKFFQLKKYTKKIRKLDKFVEACRICLDIINDTAENNQIIDPEKFKKMALKGNIDIYGLKFPKFQGKNKKSINWDYVATYVMDKDKDVNELMKDKMEESAEMEEVRFDDIYTEEKIRDMMKPYSDEELREVDLDQFEDSGSSFKVASSSSKKDRKRLVKLAPGFVHIVKDLQKEQRNRSRNAMIWQLDEDDMREIEEYDAKYNRKKYGDVPEFKGEATNSDDVEAFLYQMEQWERENTMVEFNGRRITVEEMEDIEYKKMLEANGWNLRNIYGNKEKEKQRKKAKDDEQKRIKRLKKMLKNLQDKKDEKLFDAYGNEIEDREEKKKNKKKIKKEKQKIKKNFNRLLLDVADAVDEEDIKGYKKRMEKMMMDD